MNFQFLKKDYDELEKRIQEKQEELRNISKEIGISCNQTSETWHDNFGFEESTRQHTVALQQLMELKHLRNNASIIKPTTATTSVSMGKIVTIQNNRTKKEMTVFISSYRIFNKKYEQEISYTSPVATAIMNLHIGQTGMAKTENVTIPFTVRAIINPDKINALNS